MHTHHTLILTLFSLSTLTTASPSEPLITPAPAPLNPRQDPSSSSCLDLSSSIFLDHPNLDPSVISFLNTQLFSTSKNSPAATKTISSINYSSICSNRRPASPIITPPPELSSAYESYLSASSSWVSRSDVQSIGKELRGEKCSHVIGDYALGTILMQIQTDVSDCVSAFELVEAGRKNTAVATIMSTESTGGAAGARETGLVGVVGLVGVMGVIGAMGF
ncbi:hypothetical protein QBC38DRAFT_478113 [Podospora fimiseda]|uniref:Uncharacterized protein n=1 Tax=Podospora fimiseda TaxID=252190 RepID=A0AAN7BPT5_9PEZI|nr:hypothetical protein QBC38DRAFT_478113 [Podospora fimiseda]